ncbi:2'-5' RNA ligase family protein, partial [uncultured Amnibacterium sp.]|uniref:2'-5' RNA ligase family protein n=1 Tax=uncultured Amnibacterium sp. TaxID=1631851 RepID=UPI0035CC80B0
YSIGLPLVPLGVGDVVDRSAWVPHVTLIGNFLLPEGAADTAIAVLRRFAAEVPAISIRVEGEARFGPDGSVLVDLVEAPLLRDLHGRLLSALEAAIDGLEMLLPTHTREGYHPHRTVTAGARPARGDVLTATDVILSEVEPDGWPGSAVVLAAWQLGTGAPDAVVGADLVDRVLGALAGVPTVIVGGWGVDAIVGEQTRPHHDLDLLVEDALASDAVARLEDLGFAVRFVWIENAWTGRAGRLVPSAFVAIDAAGHEVDVHTVPPERIPALRTTGVIGGAAVACAGVRAQLDMHTGYELPERQRGDVELLRRLLRA